MVVELLGGALLLVEPAELEDALSDPIEAIQEELETSVADGEEPAAVLPEDEALEAAVDPASDDDGEPEDPEGAEDDGTGEADEAAAGVCENEEKEEPEKPRPVPKLRTAGGVLTALGIGGVLAGGALMGARSDGVAEGEEGLSPVHYRTPGAIALGVGAAALAVGATLLVLDHRKRKREKGEATALVGPGPGLGLAVAGRF